MSDQENKALTKQGAAEVAIGEPASVESLTKQVATIQEAMSSVMRVNEHYGTIPGTNKPTLLKSGAEKLSLLFRLSPTYDINKVNHENGHREYEVVCTLKHIPTGNIVGQGVGTCATLESKYRYRKEGRKCPECHNETIIKGKKEHGGGWLCYKKKGGCGAKWSDGDSVIEDQEVGRVENPDIADVYNTVMKMGKKRAHVDAILTATGASDIFTQDLEDLKGMLPDEDINGVSDEEQQAFNNAMDDFEDAGKEIYGNDWAKKRSELAYGISKKQTDDPLDLNVPALKYLTNTMLKKHKQSQEEVQDAEVVDESEEMNGDQQAEQLYGKNSDSPKNGQQSGSAKKEQQPAVQMGADFEDTIDDDLPF